MEKNHLQSSKRGAFAWFWQRISAIVLFVLLLMHFITYHFLSSGQPVTYQQVVTKLQKYGIWFSLLQFIFLLTALFHGLNGLFNILEDYVHKKGWRMLFYSLIIFGGLVLFFIGMVTIIKLLNRF